MTVYPVSLGKRIAIVVVAIAVLLPARVLGYDFWLTLTPFLLSSGDWARVAIAEGDRFPEAGEPLELDDVDEIVLVRPGGARSTNEQWNLRPELKGLVFDLHVPSREPGTAVVAVSTKPEVATVSASVFTSYLKEAKLDAIVRERARRGESDRSARERFTVLPKTLLRVGLAPQAGAASQVMRAVGAPLALEIVPEGDPYALHPGAALVLRVLFRGAPLAEAIASATYESFAGKADPYAWTGSTDAAGRVVLPLAAAGPWLVRVVHMVRLDHDAAADWESYWASLTFELPR